MFGPTINRWIHFSGGMEAMGGHDKPQGFQGLPSVGLAEKAPPVPSCLCGSAVGGALPSRERERRWGSWGQKEVGLSSPPCQLSQSHALSGRIGLCGATEWIEARSWQLETTWAGRGSWELESPRTNGGGELGTGVHVCLLGGFWELESAHPRVAELEKGRSAV